MIKFIILSIFILMIFILISTFSNRKKCNDISESNKYIPSYDIKPLKKNTCHFLKKCLEKLGVIGAVGIPGRSTLHFYQQIVRDPNWNVVLTRHEENAGFIANGSFRSSRYTKRKFIICFSTTGPGSSNICTPIADSTCDYVPSIYVTNDLAEYNLTNPININRNRNIQDVDPEDIFGGLAKSIVRITMENVNSGDFIDEILTGFKKSFTFPQGSLVIVIGDGTSNIQYDENKENELIRKIENIPYMFKNEIGLEIKDEYKIYSSSKIIGFKNLGEYNMMIDNFNKKNKDKIVTNNIYDFLNKSLLNSKKPLIIIGNGCFDIINSLYEWIHMNNIPYLTSLPLQGYTNKNDPICARRMGHIATYSGNLSSYNCDWLLCLGVSFNKYQFISDKKEDIFPNANYVISWNLYPELTEVPYLSHYIVSDVIEILNWNIDQNNKNSKWLDWINEISQYKKKEIELDKSVFYKESPILQYGTVINSIQRIADSFLYNNNDKKVWIVTDVGMNQIIIPNLFVFRNIKNYKFITSSKYATVGSGLGIAMGIAMVNPDDLVILFSGDLGIQMCLSDWITIKEANIKNLVVFITENSGFSLIETENRDLDLTETPYANGYKETINWAKMIEGSLIPYYIWTDNSKKDVEQLIKKKLFKNSFFCVCVLENDVMVSPFVPLNHNITDMIYTPGGKAIKFNKERGKLISNNC